MDIALLFAVLRPTLGVNQQHVGVAVWLRESGHANIAVGVK